MRVCLQGHPFMESLRDNKALFYSIGISGSVLLALASGLVPELSAQFELVEFPSEVRGISEEGM